MMKQISRLPPIDETRAALIKGHGARITPLEYFTIKLTHILHGGGTARTPAG